MNDMTDDELMELGRATLHGPLPQKTQNNLMGCAFRLKTERDVLRAQLKRATEILQEIHDGDDVRDSNEEAHDVIGSWLIEVRTVD